MTYPIRVRAGAFIIQNGAVLLIEFNDEHGLHYNLPAGGVDAGESIKEAVKREAKEEACVDVEVGSIAFVYEYAPHLNADRFGKTHSLGLMFECHIIGETLPKLPDNPDPNQTGVKWVPLSELQNIILYPNIRKHILDFSENKAKLELLEEQTLEEYV